jgi:type II secretory pathway pseudopilin PulG
MEPERKIEKLLRAYAQRRRTAAGDPLKLHPATRRLLQGEVSRRAAKPGTEESSVSLWQLFRQQWAFLFGFALMVFLGATLFFPAMSASKKRAQNISAMNHLQQIGLAAQTVAGENNGKLPATLDELTNGLVSKQTLTDPVSGKPFVYLAGSKKLDDLESNDVLAYSPADKDGRAVLLADGRVEYATKTRFSELTKQKSTELTLAKTSAPAQPAQTTAYEPAPVASPAPAPEVAGEPKELPSGTSGIQSFVQTGVANQQNLYRNVSASAQAAPVLQSFQIVQNGDVVSVVDRDGSVYHGSVQIAAVKGNEAKGTSPNEATPPMQREQEAEQRTDNQRQAAQNYFFRVMGTNRTLQQNVVFSGTVEALPGAIANAPQSSGGGGGGGVGDAVQNKLQVSTNQQQSLLSNSRVVGPAVIDSTNQIEINAVPVSQ